MGILGSIGDALFGGDRTDEAKQDTTRKPAPPEDFQKNLMDAFMKNLFPEAGENGEIPLGLQDWMRANWFSEKETGQEYLNNLQKNTDDLKNTLAGLVPNIDYRNPMNISLGGFSAPFLSGSQRYALGEARTSATDIYSLLDTLAGRKAAFNTEYGIPYGPEEEYWNEIIKPLTAWSEHLRWGMPSESTEAEYTPSWFSSLLDIGKTAASFIPGSGGETP
jgi:hypothetical protein